MPVISLVIQKGGSGKTTTAVNLAAALQLTGKKILLVDADPQANLSQSFGIADEPERNLYTEIKKEINGEDGKPKKQSLKSSRDFQYYLLPLSWQAPSWNSLVFMEGRVSSIPCWNQW